MLLKLTGGAHIQPGRVKLELPVLADNGNSVSLKVSIDSPMTADSFVKSIHIYAARNPRPNVANFYLGPRAGRARPSPARSRGVARVPQRDARDSAPQAAW